MSEQCERTNERISKWPSTLRIYSLIIRLTVQCAQVLMPAALEKIRRLFESRAMMDDDNFSSII